MRSDSTLRDADLDPPRHHLRHGGIFGKVAPSSCSVPSPDDFSMVIVSDHIVALSNAWQTGAQQLDTGTREEFANDPLNLQATDGPANQAKGDGDAATWLPPNRAPWCLYVARQVAVKARYGLRVTPRRA